mmetsp:Transcript_87433/g.271673  ORF Transcript_87433/g.271673 Transcript_87433/m.271673 type:complete len:225 (+) Transcript_87433:1265-1939(+)
MLIALVCDLHANAQALSSTLFLRSRLEAAAELICWMPPATLRDTPLHLVRGNMLSLLLDTHSTWRTGSELRVGGVRAFVSTKFGYGVGGWMFLACSATIFLPISLPWACALLVARRLGGTSADAWRPERFFSALDAAGGGPSKEEFTHGLVLQMMQAGKGDHDKLVARIDDLARRHDDLTAKMDRFSSAVLQAVDRMAELPGERGLSRAELPGKREMSKEELFL